MIGAAWLRVKPHGAQKTLKNNVRFSDKTSQKRPALAACNRFSVAK